MKTIIPLLLLIAFALPSCSKHYCKKGNAYYKTMQYDKAIDNYTKVSEKKMPREEKIKLADSYRLTNDYKNAEKLYAELVAIPKMYPIHLFYYGKSLMNNGKYKEAKKEFSNYLVLTDTDPITETLIASCDSCNKFYADSSLYSVKSVEIPNVTTAFGQVNYADGLVFTADKGNFNSTYKKSGWTGRSYLDLYFSCKMEDGKWSEPEPLNGEINGLFHEGPAVFNKDKTVVYFTRSNYSTTKTLKKNGENESNLKMFSAELKGGIWTNLKELPINSDNYSCGHPALSSDEQTLYFISDMPRGFGATDIYKISKTKNQTDDEEWSFPENLGPCINTSGNEMFPYVAPNEIFYFSSDAHSTLGGLDIFSYTLDNTNVTVPENLNYPINSSKDDFALTLNDDNKTGYISSNRDNLDKIYEIRLSDPVFILKGTITQKANGELLEDAVVEITTNKNKYKQILSVDDLGNYTMKLKAGIEYSIQAVMEGYLKPEVVTISTANKIKSETFIVNFQLEKIQLEEPIVLENIYYDLDKWKIRKDAASELDKFVSLLNNNPQIFVELNSHTDARAEDNYNQALSNKRAKAAIDYLIKKGVDSNRLKSKGYGESVLVNDCKNNILCDEYLHQQNRRTEFKIIKISELASENQ